MKKLMILALFLFCSKFSHSAALVVESPVNGFGSPVTVSISTSAWTKVPTTQTSGRFGIIIDAPATINANIVAHIGNCTSTSIATTVRPIEIIRTNGSQYFSLREDVCMWVLSLHTAAESINYQEVKQ